MTRAPDEIVALDPAATYEAAEVAQIVFHVSHRTLRRRMMKLRSEGFPRSVSQWGRRVWSGQDLIDWLARPKGVLPANVLPFGPRLAETARSAARSGAKSAR